MYCNECGTEIPDTFKYCKKCGAKQTDKMPEKDTTDIPSTFQDHSLNSVGVDGIQTEKKDSIFVSILGKAVGLLGALIGLGLGRTLGIFPMLMLIVPALLGAYFTSWYFKNKTVNMTLVKVITWLNVATWLSPSIGMFTSVSTLRFIGYDKNNKIKYIIFGTIGLVLSIGNFGYAAYLGLTTR